MFAVDFVEQDTVCIFFVGEGRMKVGFLVCGWLNSSGSEGQVGLGI